VRVRAVTLASTQLPELRRVSAVLLEDIQLWLGEPAALTGALLAPIRSQGQVLAHTVSPVTYAWSRYFLRNINDLTAHS